MGAGAMVDHIAKRVTQLSVDKRPRLSSAIDFESYTVRVGLQAFANLRQVRRDRRGKRGSASRVMCWYKIDVLSATSLRVSAGGCKSYDSACCRAEA